MKTIETYFNRNIKDIIEQYPKVGEVLKNAGIGCTECTMGTCPMGEIVNVHGLCVEEERKLLTDIAAVMFPGEQVEIPVTDRAPVAEKSICPPIRRMVDEHAVILRFIDCIPALCKSLRTDGIDEPAVRKAVDFIKGFADGYHHAKEEAVLFTFFDQSSEIVDSFLKEHENGRLLVQNILAGLKNGDAAVIVENLESYSVLLSEHISKENDILFPWMNRVLTDSQVGILFARCAEIDNKYASRAREFEAFVQEVEAGAAA